MLPRRTPTITFTAGNLTYVKTQYPNTNIHSGFPGIVIHFSVSPVTNITQVECKINGGAHVAKASLFGGTLGFIASTDPAVNPVAVQTMADFNTARYARAFAKVVGAKSPKQFPIVDRFIGGMFVSCGLQLQGRTLI